MGIISRRKDWTSIVIRFIIGQYCKHFIFLLGSGSVLGINWWSILLLWHISGTRRRSALLLRAKCAACVTEKVSMFLKLKMLQTSTLHKYQLRTPFPAIFICFFCPPVWKHHSRIPLFEWSYIYPLFKLCSPNQVMKLFHFL